MVRSDDELFDAEGMHVLDVTRDPDVGGGQGLVVLVVESDADLTGCPGCGTVSVGHGRRDLTSLGPGAVANSEQRRPAQGTRRPALFGPDPSA
ncbi:hypothetical protein [Streptomyces sp. NPDC057557]|uniref:hypothetical protein n=1 Tax=Streptomyces sp. NPDC057557 TaxID=3346167 RepID=UPI0036CB1CCE